MPIRGEKFNSVNGEWKNSEWSKGSSAGLTKRPFRHSPFTIHP